MVAQRFGSADPDMRSRSGKGGKTKEVKDKPGLKASTRVPTTGMIGGISNRTTPPSAAKGSGGFPAFRRGGSARKR